MDYRLEIFPRQRYAILTTSGEASVEGFRQSNRELAAHPLWERGMNLLLDHRPLDSTGLTSADIRQLASPGMGYENLPGIRKIATVVETDAGFGLTRMWESYAAGSIRPEHRIFRSMEEAQQWLEEPESEPAADPRGNASAGEPGDSGPAPSGPGKAGG